MVKKEEYEKIIFKLKTFKLKAVEDELSYFSTTGIGSLGFKALGLAGITGGLYYGHKVIEVANKAYEASQLNHEALTEWVYPTALLGIVPAAMIAGGVALFYVSYKSKKEDAQRVKELKDEREELRANPVYRSLEETLT